MIGRLQGKVIEKQAPDLLIDVQGLGYEVLVSLNTFLWCSGSGRGGHSAHALCGARGCPAALRLWHPV